MTSLVSFDNLKLKTNEPINTDKSSQSFRCVGFKANEKDQFVKQNSVSTKALPSQKDSYTKAIEEQKKKEKKQKIKNNMTWGIGIASGLAIIALVVANFAALRGGKDAKRIKELTNAIKNIKDPGIKREAEEELARQPYERSLYRIEDLIQLDKLANTVEKRTPANIEATTKKMNAEVIGMEEAKQPILDFLEGINYDIKNGITHDKPLILCVDGPPGTGKSTLMKSIADSLGMYFKKISLSSTKNPEAITGFERTYAGATPGLMAKAQLEGNTKKVVYGLDEFEKADEKVINTFLSILDDQIIFTDKYYNANVDLSQSIFVITTNQLERLKGTPIYNRIKPHTIKVKPYNNDVKTQIAELKMNGALKQFKLNDKVEIDDDVCRAIVEHTTDQGGRETTQFVEKIVKAMKKAANNNTTGGKVKVDRNFVEEALKNIEIAV